MKRILTLALLTTTCALLACWGGGGGGSSSLEVASGCHGHSDYTYNAFGKINGRFVYIAGVNNDASHINAFSYSEGVEYGESTTGVDADGNVLWTGSSSTYTGSIGFTALNNQTVSLPLTVYVGILHFAGPESDPYVFPGTNSFHKPWGGTWNNPDYSPGLSTSMMTIKLQYRVDPDTTWKTVRTIYYMNLTNPIFNTWDTAAGGEYGAKLQWSRKRLVFGKGVIDGNYPAGSKMLIRISVSNGQYNSPDESSPIVSSFADIPDSKDFSVSAYSCGIGAQTCGSCGQNSVLATTYYGLADTFAFGGDGDRYGGWSPLHFMSVTISGDRRPNP